MYMQPRSLLDGPRSRHHSTFHAMQPTSSEMISNTSWQTSSDEQLLRTPSPKPESQTDQGVVVTPGIKGRGTKTTHPGAQWPKLCSPKPRSRTSLGSATPPGTPAQSKKRVLTSLAGDRPPKRAKTSPGPFATPASVSARASISREPDEGELRSHFASISPQRYEERAKALEKKLEQEHEASEIALRKARDTTRRATESQTRVRLGLEHANMLASALAPALLDSMMDELIDIRCESAGIEGCHGKAAREHLTDGDVQQYDTLHAKIESWITGAVMAARHDATLHEAIEADHESELRAMKEDMEQTNAENARLRSEQDIISARSSHRLENIQHLTAELETTRKDLEQAEANLQRLYTKNQADKVSLDQRVAELTTSLQQSEEHSQSITRKARSRSVEISRLRMDLQNTIALLNKHAIPAPVPSGDDAALPAVTPRVAILLDNHRDLEERLESAMELFGCIRSAMATARLGFSAENELMPTQ